MKHGKMGALHEKKKGNKRSERDRSFRTGDGSEPSGVVGESEKRDDGMDGDSKGAEGADWI